MYYKEALGALVVYDISRPPTFESVTKWKRDLDEKVALPDVLGGGPIPVILLANKVIRWWLFPSYIAKNIIHNLVRIANHLQHFLIV